MEGQRKPRRIVRGVVISRSGDKSIRIEMKYKIKHPVYGKFVRRSTKLGVHDEKNQAGIGDVVEVTECRPMSKSKSWRLVQIVQKAQV
ncbi:MAG: 30S ribosomal protein S17 [Planctomycetes bacterium]|nr:30S ribosomal protein S17 [Planctomycetota bacterium]MBU1517315.1 30S ribosomal protein S17 [Planctomycetota bacterium]MBU2458419.1 30S ribosomal protein S17 [Planctomycetota bacterium]MBU2596445.1 30S ribosomal protein S17 [Planctomycetota bacterium]